MSFADLKKQSRSGSLTERLMKKVEKLNEKGNNTDERLWKPAVDKAGNGYAVVRFLPQHANMDLPWVQVWSHAFQGPGGWYIENSLTTIAKSDPVGDLNRQLWNSGSDRDKDIARKQKRKLSYYSNIYVVQDPLHPENEGKVFLYKYGKKIHDKILAAMQPEFQDETPINVFDLWEGANFKLKIKKVAGYWNYDSSEFDSVSALSADDAELEATWKLEHSLEAFTAKDNFKSYDDLEARLNLVLGSPYRAPASVSREELETPIAAPPTASVTPSSFRQKVGAAASPVKKEAVVEDDDALSYFASLASDD